VVAERAADAHGVLSLAELLECGLTESAIARRVQAGRLHRVHRGVYAVGHPGLTDEGRWLAAVKACGAHAVLSHASSLMLFGLLPTDDRRACVTVPHGCKHRPAGIRVHRARTLGPYDVWRRHGIRATAPARTILDVSATWTDEAVRGLMSRAQSMNLANLRTLARQLDHAAGRPTARYARVLAGRPPRTRSVLEDRVHDLIVAGGFEPPDVNIALDLGGRRVIPDFRWPAQRLCVEADGRRWHDNPQARADDAERQALLEAHGERVLRVTWEQATAGAAQTVARFAAAGAPRPRARP
jgi:predicted transcriptional regulator of viral defense system